MTDQNLLNTMKIMIKGDIALLAYIRKKERWKSTTSFSILGKNSVEKRKE